MSTWKSRNLPASELSKTVRSLKILRIGVTHPSRLRRAISIVLPIWVLLSAAFCLASPVAGGELKGTVSDPNGAAIAGARVLVRERSGLTRYQTRTDARGEFMLSTVAEGEYSISVEAPGFWQPEPETVTVRAGGVETANIELEIAAIAEQMIVSATRTDTPSSQLGGSVSLIGGEHLERSNNTLVTESLRLIPGVAVVQTGGRGGLTSLFVRGGESDYNKVLIDGVPVNAAGGLFDFSELTPENFERIEVARGPRSALFGSDAMTSVVQLFTRRGATEVPELTISAEGGNLAFHREVARLSGMHSWFDYSASFGHQTVDGRSRNGDYTNRSGSANLGFRLSPEAELRVTARSGSHSAGVPGPTAVLFPDPDQRQKQRRMIGSAALDLRTGPGWQHVARFIYSEADTRSFDPIAQDLSTADTPPLPPFAFGNDFAFDFTEHQKRFGVHYQTIVAASEAHFLTGGLEFERESAVFTEPFSRVSPERDNLGFYLQDQIGWRDLLFVTAGIRIEHNRGKVPADLRRSLSDLGAPVGDSDVGFGFAANPKVAAVVIARGHNEASGLGRTRIKASFGTGIKEPSLLEAFSPNMFFLGNPLLDPERATSFDAGVVQEFFDKRATVEVSYYDNRFRDLIVFRFDPANFGPIRLPSGSLTNFVNLERASARGVELIAAVRPTRELHLSGHYTFTSSSQDGEEGATSNVSKLPLLRRPRHSGAFEAAWVEKRFDFSVEGIIVGQRHDIDPITFASIDAMGKPVFNEAYWKLNLAGAAHFTRNVSLITRVDNLLNEDYQEVLGFPAYRLNFTAGIRVKFGGGR